MEAPHDGLLVDGRTQQSQNVCSGASCVRAYAVAPLLAALVSTVAIIYVLATTTIDHVLDTPCCAPVSLAACVSQPLVYGILQSVAMAFFGITICGLVRWLCAVRQVGTVSALPILDQALVWSAVGTMVCCELHALIPMSCKLPATGTAAISDIVQMTWKTIVHLVAASMMFVLSAWHCILLIRAILTDQPFAKAMRVSSKQFKCVIVVVSFALVALSLLILGADLDLMGLPQWIGLVGMIGGYGSYGYELYDLPSLTDRGENTELDPSHSALHSHTEQ